MYKITAASELAEGENERNLYLPRTFLIQQLLYEHYNRPIFIVASHLLSSTLLLSVVEVILASRTIKNGLTHWYDFHLSQLDLSVVLHFAGLPIHLIIYYTTVYIL